MWGGERGVVAVELGVFFLQFLRVQYFISEMARWFSLS